MRSFHFLVRMLITWLVGATPLAGLASVAVGATETKPVAVVCVSSYDGFLQNLDTVGQLVGRTQLRDMAEGTVAAFTAGRGFAGIDQTKPWGITVSPQGSAWQGGLFIPITDFSQVLETLRLLSPDGLPEIQPGVYRFQSPRGTVFATSRDGYAFFAQQVEHLESLPTSPELLVDNLAKQYDLSVRLNVQALPQYVKTLAISQVQRGANIGLQRLADETDQQFAHRRQMTERQLDRLVALIDETTDVTLGWKLEDEAEFARFDVNVAGIKGGRLATQTAAWDSIQSRFSGFIRSNASLSMNLTTPIMAEDIEQGLQSLALLRQQALQSLPNEQAKVLFGEFWDILEDTLRQGTLDAAGFVNTANDQINFAAGLAIANATRLEDTFKQLISEYGQQAAVKVQWNVAEVKGVQLHNVQVPASSGRLSDVIVGFSKDAVYLAAHDSGDAQALLEDSLNNSERAVEPTVLPFQLSLTPSALILSQPKIRQEMSDFASVWRGAHGEDRFGVRVEPIENGVRYRLQLDRAALKVLGKLAAQRARN